MKNYQIAGQIVPCALRAANEAEGSPLGAETLIQLAGAVSSAVAVHGIKNQRLIRKAAMKITPDFAQISDTFFQVLKETAVIGEAARSKNYEEITGFIIENPDMTAKERLHLYGELTEEKSAKLFKIIKKACMLVIILTIVGCVCIYAFVPEVHDQFKADIEKAKKNFSRFKKIFSIVKKILSKAFGLIAKAIETL